ncbi:UNVERIFIED_CONTAM: hypothetical protein RMT77_006420 [Armadillidium vulgare]
MELQATVLSVWVFSYFTVIYGLNDVIKTNNIESFEKSIETEQMNDKELDARNQRQERWLQPPNFALLNFNPVKKNVSAFEKDAEGGRFFKIVKKESILTPIEMIAKGLKKAIEDLNTQFKRFSATFAIYVQNEVDRVAEEPDLTTRFADILSTIVEDCTVLITQSSISLIQALSNFLGIPLTGLLGSLLGDATIGGLPLIGSGTPAGIAGGLIGLLPQPLLG